MSGSPSPGPKPIAAAGRFDHYEIAKNDDGSFCELGRGAMGITYKAFDTALERVVALKVINGDYLDSEAARQRFLREARLAAQFKHENVVPVFHLGHQGNTYFYAMELIEGETLAGRIKRGGPVEPLEALRIAAQVARALIAAQQRQLIHRDVKPSNIMLVENPGGETNVKVIDFGLVKSIATNAPGAGAVTRSGFVGTPHYASPEQLDEQPLDIRSDIYSLGVTLWYALTGRCPFTGSVASVISQHLSKPPPVEELKTIPAPLRQLLLRMLEKKPAGRPQNAQELRDEIEQCAAALGGGDPRKEIEEREAEATRGKDPARAKGRLVPGELSRASPEPRWRLLLALLVVLGAVGAAEWWFGFEQPHRHSTETRTHGPLDSTGTDPATRTGIPASLQTLLVPDQFSSIQGAIDAAKTGDIIQVRAGLYQGPLIFKEGIHLVGDGRDKVTVHTAAAEGRVLTVEGCRSGSISDICFEHIGSGTSAQSFAAVAIGGSEVELLRCRVRNSGVDGIRLHSGDRSTISHCEVTDCAKDGIHATDSATAPTIKNCTVRNNGLHGISFNQGAGGLAGENTCDENAAAGLAVFDAGTAPTLRHNLARKNKLFGILVAQGAAGAIEKNVCEHNEDAGIGIADPGSAPTVRGNEANANQEFGILFQKGAAGVAEDNRCETNGGAGIGVFGAGTAPILGVNHALNNKQSNVYVEKGAAPRHRKSP